MAGRKGDITMIVAQKNYERKLTIESVDESLGKIKPMIGYEAMDLTGKKLTDYLTPSVIDLLDDYLEYSHDGKDLADVLSKCRTFEMISQKGTPVKFQLRIQRGVTMDENARFVILMRSEDKVAQGVLHDLEKIKLTENLEDITGLPDAQFFMKAASIVHSGVKEGNTQASMAIIQIDAMDVLQLEQEKSVINSLLKEVTLRCCHTFRDTDIISYGHNGRFGVILLEADIKSALIPLQRLRSLVANQPLHLHNTQPIHATLSITLRQLKPNEPVEETLQACEHVLLNDALIGNRVLEA